MPIIDVEVVGALDPAVSEGLAARIADLAGDILGARPGGTWVKLRIVDHYAESAGGPPDGVEPVFVRVLQSQPPTGDAFAEAVTALTRAVADACARAPGHVHVIWEPPATGRAAFGGRIA